MIVEAMGIAEELKEADEDIMMRLLIENNKGLTTTSQCKNYLNI